MNDPYLDTDDLLLIAPPIYMEDLYQEAELLKLMGKTPSMRLLKRKAATYYEVLFAEDLPPSVTATPLFEGSLLPPQDVIEQLVDWAIQQSAEVSNLVLEFLQDPSDQELGTVIHKLQLGGFISPPITEADPTKSISFATLILNLVSHRPHTLEELYEFGRENLINRRPEATVRQAIRRLTRQGKIRETSHECYIRA